MFSQDIMCHVAEHRYYVNKMLPNDRGELMVIAANGSVNYGLDTADSDVDTKAIYVPCLRDITTQYVMSKNYVVSGSRWADGEKCDVKDIREYTNMLLKANINFMETLYSDYVQVNPRFGENWACLVRIREDIAYGCPVRAVECMMGMASRYNKIIQDRKQLDCGKPFYHICRMQYALKHYTQEDNYIKVIYPDEKTAKYLKAFKTNAAELSAADYRRLAAEKMEIMARDYETTYKPWAQAKRDTIGNQPAFMEELFRITGLCIKEEIK